MEERETMPGNIRNTNIEWLRIVSMLLIVAAHGTVIGCYSTDVSLYVFTCGQILGSWGILGVDLFLIIGAWFLVDQKFRISKVTSIVWNTFTWVLAYSILSVIYVFRETRSFSAAVSDLGQWAHKGLIEPFWAYAYWFVTAYFFMMLAAPLMNKIIDSASQTGLKKGLLILMFIPVCSQFGPNFIVDIVYFCYVYLLVGYVKRYGIRALEKYAKPGVFLALSTAIIAARMAFYLPDTEWTLFLKEVLNLTIGAVNRHSVVMLVDAFLIFFWVSKQIPHYNRLVNKIAACTFGVYLFHGNFVASFPTVVHFIFNKCVQWRFITFTRRFPFQYVLAVLLTFMIGTVIEYFRQLTIQKPVMKLLEKHCSGHMAKIDQWFNSL